MSDIASVFGMSRNSLFISLFWLTVCVLVSARIYFYEEPAKASHLSASPTETYLTYSSQTGTR